MDKRNKERLRRALRALLLFFAVLLLVVSLLIPVINNFIAAGVVHDLEALPLPAGTTIHDSVSAAGNLDGRGGEMQYFGAVLLRSDLSLEELNQYYLPYRKGLFDCLVKEQSGTKATPVENMSLVFDVDVEGEDWYILYTWGKVPDWAADWLNMDIRRR